MSSNTQRLTLNIEGMSCGHCVAAVKAALDDVPGVAVEGVAVGSATIAVDPTVSTPAAAVDAIRDAGYEAAIATPAY